jgi:acyl CoA:acetate/3-ketoacid CoA transferase beta subunit
MAVGVAERFTIEDVQAATEPQLIIVENVKLNAY